MIDKKDLPNELSDLRAKLRRTLRHEGSATALVQLTPMFLGFLEHEDRLHREVSPEVRAKLEALRAAAVTLTERVKDAEGEPMEHIRGHVVNALTPRTAPASTFEDDGLVRAAVATALEPALTGSARRVADGRPARELVNGIVQQSGTLVEVIDQILQPAPGHACEVIACSVAQILTDGGFVVSAATNGELDAALRHVLEALGCGGVDRVRLVEVAVERMRPSHGRH